MSLKKFVVIDAEGIVSYCDKTEASEAFNSLRAAEKRAREIAVSDAGKPVGIYQLVEKVTAPIGRSIFERVSP